MSRETFRVRLSQLIQKSRKALKLYTSMAEVRNGGASEAQLAEWRDVNARLATELQKALSFGNVREASEVVFQLRDRFYGEWRFAEAELHEKQDKLIELAESAQFARVVQLAEDLVKVKARKQATQAAHHELDGLLLGSSPVASQDSPYSGRAEGDVVRENTALNPNVTDMSAFMFDEADDVEPLRQSAGGAKVLTFSGRRHS